MSGDNSDQFGDIINQSAGIFDSGSASISGHQGGLSGFDSASTTPTAAGVAIGMQCRGCGRPVQLTAEWPELMCLKYQVSPHFVLRNTQGIVSELTEWQYTSAQEGWAPRRACRYCQTWVAPIITTDEAERLLVKGRRAGWFTPQLEKGVSDRAYAIGQQIAQQLAAQGRG